MTTSMRELFKEHYKLTDAEHDLIWENAIFVFDTNSLLNIYRYSTTTRDDFFKVLTALKDRMWIPHQVAKEFFKNRINVIIEQNNKYQELIDKIEKSLSLLQDGTLKKSGFLNLNEVEAIMKPSVEKSKALIQKQRENHPDLLKNDLYLAKLESIIGENVGPEFTDVGLEKIYKSGKKRFENKQPPGYKDSQKPEPECYGDLVIWHQILDYAEKEDKPIILVTDDEKEDWWLEIKGSKIGPRPELRKELRDTSKHELIVIRPAYLIEVAPKRLEIKITEGSVEDAKQVSEDLLDGIYPVLESYSPSMKRLLDLDIRTLIYAHNFVIQLNTVISRQPFLNLKQSLESLGNVISFDSSINEPNQYLTIRVAYANLIPSDSIKSILDLNGLPADVLPIDPVKSRFYSNQ